jgi:hypothetical protein
MVGWTRRKRRSTESISAKGMLASGIHTRKDPGARKNIQHQKAMKWTEMHTFVYHNEEDCWEGRVFEFLNMFINILILTSIPVGDIPRY